METARFILQREGPPSKPKVISEVPVLLQDRIVRLKATRIRSKAGRVERLSLSALSLVTGFEMDPATPGRPNRNVLTPQDSRVVVLRQR